MKIALKEDIYRIDRLCHENFHIPVSILMENAGIAVYTFILENLREYLGKKFLFLCGTGNNGGDGAVAARKLILDGCIVSVILADSISSIKGDAKTNFDILNDLKCRFILLKDIDKIESFIPNFDIIIDAVFGIGFHGEPDSEISGLFKAVNHSGKTIISVDIPSGVYAGGGASKDAIKADFTITLGLPKLGMIDFPGREFTGKRIINKINIPDSLLNDKIMINNLITDEEICNIYQPRIRNTYKGSYGHLLIIGGSAGNIDNGDPGMSGAVIIAGTAALRAGTGLLTIACEDKNSIPVKTSLPEALTLGIDPTDLEKSIQCLNKYIIKRKIKSVLFGNGFGTGEFQMRMLKYILEEKQIKKLVIDADGLNILANYPEMKKIMKKSGKEIILTPHIGEMARLVNTETGLIIANKIKTAGEFSSEFNSVVILKDSISVIAGSGEIWLNEKGSSSLAKGGSGDILAGLIAGLFESGYSALNSSILGIYILSRAGEIYDDRFGTESALSRDILSLIPDVWKLIYKDFSSDKTFIKKGIMG